MLQPIETKNEPWSSGGEGMALLAAGAAHELNNPLSVIVGYLSLILAGKTTPDRVLEQLQKVQAEATHCRLVLEGLSQLAEFNQGDVAALDLSALLQEALDEVPEVVVRVVGTSGLVVTGREHGLLLLLRQLLRNVRESGARSLTIATSLADAALRLELRDDGVGLSDKAQRRAKEPFFSTKSGQLGLGLTIGELVAAAHAGSLELLPSPGGGTTAIVRLPLATSSAERP